MYFCAKNTDLAFRRIIACIEITLFFALFLGRMFLPICAKKEGQGEPKHDKQARTKAFEIISLPSRLIQRRTVLPFHGKSVLDSKMMVEWIRPNLCPNLCPNLRQEGRHGEPKHSKQTRTKAFEIISHPYRLIQRRPVLPFHGNSVLYSMMMVECIRPKLWV